MKTIKSTFLLLACLAFLNVCGQNSKEEKKAARALAVKNMVDSRRYLFQAQSAMPMKGGSRQLSSGYTFTVSPDTVISDLPYYGRSYQAPINPSDAGIKFTSSDFEYTVKNGKKGGWDIMIQPKDVRNSPQVNITISESGFSSVRVTSNDRQPISFSGNIEEPKQKRP